MPSLWDQTASSLLDQTSGHKPTPGGGSVAALSAAFGAGLLLMAAEITRRKARTPLPELERPVAELRTAQGRLRDLADEDVAVFRAFVAATRQPGGPERDQAMAQALAAARQTPLEIARQSAAALAQARALLAQVHPEVISDVGAGAALLRGGVQAALLTLDINLRELTPDELAEWQTKRDELDRATAADSEATLRLTREKLAQSHTT